jgi:LmbE family N-acetylglucosaminyl deacetylase
MKHSPTLPAEPLLAFGAHPDDIEFGCGAVVCRETRGGRPAHLVVCSRGEAGSNGSPAVRVAEATEAARLQGATLQFIDLDGDAHLEIRSAHAIRLAGIIRQVRPQVVLAPTLEQNQHPDHWRLGQIVRDATKLARYGGLQELQHLAPHAVERTFWYAVSPDAEPAGTAPVLVDISEPELVALWTAAMQAHVSQLKTRNYVDLQLARARWHGLRAGVEYAQPLWAAEPLVVEALSSLMRAPRRA